MNDYITNESLYIVRYRHHRFGELVVEFKTLLSRINDHECGIPTEKTSLE